MYCKKPDQLMDPDLSPSAISPLSSTILSYNLDKYNRHIGNMLAVIRDNCLPLGFRQELLWFAPLLLYTYKKKCMRQQTCHLPCSVDLSQLMAESLIQELKRSRKGHVVMWKKLLWCKSHQNFLSVEQEV